MGHVIAILAALCGLGAFAIGATALVRDRPLPGVAVLLVPAIPVLAAGQLWAIALINARMPRRTGGWRDRVRARKGLGRNPQTFFFGELDAKLARPLLVVAFFGWLSAMIALPALAHGGPIGPGGGCRYRLDSHGSYTCVSRATYEHTGAGEQQVAGGIMLAFFAIHTGAALGGLTRRKQRDAQ